MNRALVLHTPAGHLLGQFALPEALPDSPRGLVLLPKAHRVAVDDPNTLIFRQAGYAVLAIELLSEREMHYADAAQDVARLGARLLDVLALAERDGDMERLPLAIFASGEATPAALRAAARRDAQVRALAVHGGPIDRAGLEALRMLAAPLLMLTDVDAGEPGWQRAAAHLGCPHAAQRLAPGETAGSAAVTWFGRWLAAT